MKISAYLFIFLFLPSVLLGFIFSIVFDDVRFFNIPALISFFITFIFLVRDIPQEYSWENFLDELEKNKPWQQGKKKDGEEDQRLNDD